MAAEEVEVSRADVKGEEEEEARRHLIVLCVAKTPFMLPEIANTTKWQREV